MLKFLFAMMFSVSAHAGSWVSGTIHVRDDNTKSVWAFWNNSYTGSGSVFDSWVTVDVTSLGMPSTTKSVFLSGILIITHGSTPELCNMTVSLKAYGDPMPASDYLGQVIETDVGGGQRSNFSSWVPVANGKFEIYVSKSTTSGTWPTYCSYATSLLAQSYID